VAVVVLPLEVVDVDVVGTAGLEVAGVGFFFLETMSTRKSFSLKCKLAIVLSLSRILPF
jgi:hypothetical protein